MYDTEQSQLEQTENQTPTTKKTVNYTLVAWTFQIRPKKRKSLAENLASVSFTSEVIFANAFPLGKDKQSLIRG